MGNKCVLSIDLNFLNLSAERNVTGSLFHSCTTVCTTVCSCLLCSMELQGQGQTSFLFGEYQILTQQYKVLPYGAWGYRDRV